MSRVKEIVEAYLPVPLSLSLHSHSWAVVSSGNCCCRLLRIRKSRSKAISWWDSGGGWWRGWQEDQRLTEVGDVLGRGQF